MMHATFARLVDRLDGDASTSADVLEWGAPVPVFGDPATAAVATLGLNPSDREFVDAAGAELQGPARRFHTLQSLGLMTWSEAETQHLELMLRSCREYFARNPYDQWFRRLDGVLAGLDASFYPPRANACHLDVVPYATRRKWATLPLASRRRLLDVAGDTLGQLLHASPARVLVLNGQSVVEQFERMANVTLSMTVRDDWTLARSQGAPVRGVAYTGVVERIGAYEFDSPLYVLGYNHNLQSSFGVTSGVMAAIRDWIGATYRSLSGEASA